MLEDIMSMVQSGANPVCAHRSVCVSLFVLGVLSYLLQDPFLENGAPVAASSQSINQSASDIHTQPVQPRQSFIECCEHVIIHCVN